MAPSTGTHLSAHLAPVDLVPNIIAGESTTDKKNKETGGRERREGEREKGGGRRKGEEGETEARRVVTEGERKYLPLPILRGWTSLRSCYNQRPSMTHPAGGMTAMFGL